MAKNNNTLKTISELPEKAIQDERSRHYHIFNDIIAVIILASVVAIILESVEGLREKHLNLFFYAEIIFTAIFAAEYLIRLRFEEKPLRYAVGPFGIIDLLSFLPSLLAFFVPPLIGLHALRVLRVIRVLRLLRLFRVLKLIAYSQRRHRKKFSVLNSVTAVNLEIYFFALFSVVTIAGTLLYIAEADVPGSAFTNIPHGMWWALVTVTTVGYGDIVPVTVWGKIIASFTMVSGLILLALLITVVGKAAQTVLFGSPIEEEEKLLKKK